MIIPEMANQVRKPTHPDIARIVPQAGFRDCYITSQQDFLPGSTLARLEFDSTAYTRRAYSSLQVGCRPKDDIELNCDFEYTNHSCEPNLEFHVIRPISDRSETSGSDSEGSRKPGCSESIVIEIHVARRTDESGKEIGISKNEQLCFFYPSTEWDMADPFDCQCGTASCLGRIEGAKTLSREVLSRYFVNDHIWKLKRKTSEEESIGHGT